MQIQNGRHRKHLLPCLDNNPLDTASNVILSVNANETYVKAKYQDYYVIMAEALLDSVLGEGNYEVVESMKAAIRNM